MSILRKILCVCVMAAVLVMSFPVSSLAVDPVSAATMANAFAQAITAYGASHGVSMVFDISNTSQIGESIHELWKQFRSENNEIDDYLDIAASIFPSVFQKIVKAGKAYLGINLAAEYVADLDGFWNWVLTGPAEMAKVDNQYYEWEVNSLGNVNPINIFSDGVFKALPYLSQNFTNEQYFLNSESLYHFNESNNVYFEIRGFSYTNDSVYVFATPFGSESSNYQYVYFCSSSGNSLIGEPTLVGSNYSSPGQYRTDQYYTGNNGSVWYKQLINGQYSSSVNIDFSIPVFETSSEGFDEVITNPYALYGVDIAPYIGEASPQDVYIPDNEDVNYVPLPVDIPLDIPWDDSLFGDGTGALSDTQVINAVNSLDSTIEQLNSLLLAGDNSITANPTDTFNSILPFGELPSFNFNLAGIWYYVRNWVASLGSFLSALFSTWSSLPGIISLPVYATAVIVIVLGVYKRFFM